jgi:hypothetical protein
VFEHAGVTATRPERESMARMLCGQYLAVAAADAGWRIDSLPGEPIRFTRNGLAMDLLDDYMQVCGGTLDPQAWRARLSAVGRPLCSPPRPTLARPLLKVGCSMPASRP